MTGRSWALTAVTFGGLLALACGAPAAAPSAGGPGQDTPRAGGVLRALAREDPPDLSPHENITNSTLWPVFSAYNNLVTFDPAKVPESPDTVVPELAEKWVVSPDGKTITFTLRQGVKWHDGTPFSSKDVKYTIDTLKTGTDALRPESKMRVNPRGTAWYANVEAVEAPDPSTVLLRLKRPQPSLIGMLASSWSAVYPAQVPVSDIRTTVMGTGPFKLTEWKKGESLTFVKNPDYWVPGRPYMDGLQFVVITTAGTQLAAFKTHQLQVSHPGEFTKDNVDELKQALPQLMASETGGTGTDNILVNTTKAPWSNLKVRLAIAEAMDKDAYVAIRARGAVAGTPISPRGPWAYAPDELAKLPGHGPNMEQRRARAKQLLAEAGYPNGFATEVITRDIRLFTDLAPFTLDQLDRIGIKGTLKVLETPVYNTALTKGDFDIASAALALGFDDPDVMYFENFKCGEARNYGRWCNPEADRLMEQQSVTVDPAERKRLIQQLDRIVVEEAARPFLGWRMRYDIWWPEVRGYVAYAGTFDFQRMDRVWLAQ